MPRSFHLAEAGSALLYVVAAVGLASMAAMGYLSFTNYHRERAARELSVVGQAVALETRILQVKQAVEAQAIAEAKVDLSLALQAVRSDPATTSHLELLSGDGEGGPVILDRFAVRDQAQALGRLSLREDPFNGAKARVTTLNLDAWMDPAGAANSRDVDKRVAAKPEIDIRQIPLSEFTVFAAAGMNRLNAQNFDGDMGRVFSRGAIVVAGQLQTHYPLVARGNIVVAPDAALTLQCNNTEPVTVPGGFDSSTPEFFADAHSRFESELVTPQSLPVEADVVSSVYQANDPGTGPGEAFNFEAFKQDCTVHVTVRRQLVITPIAGMEHTSYNLEVTGLNNGAGRPSAPDQVAPSTMQNIGVNGPRGHTVTTAIDSTPFRVADHNGVAVVAVNCPALRGVSGPVAISIEVYGSNGLERSAQVLLRGGESLPADFSLVTPHPIVISGDFNTQTVNGVIPAASLITGQEVEVENPADAAWAQSAFGKVR